MTFPTLDEVNTEIKRDDTKKHEPPAPEPQPPEQGEDDYYAEDNPPTLEELKNDPWNCLR